MTIYLKYRLEKNNISPGEVGELCIYCTKGNWVFRDIYAELAEIFPATRVSSFEDQANRRCDMVIIPYLGSSVTPAYKFSALRAVLKLKPRYIGFYEFSKRHLLIIQRKSLPLFFTRKMIEYVLRFILRIKNKLPWLKTLEKRQK